MFLVFQILSVSTAVVYGITTIGKIIISLRSVLPQDKGLALAMEVLCLGLFAYIPVHLAFDVISRATCMYWAPHYSRCLLRETPKHGNILNILSACLIFIGLIFDILVFIYIKGLNIYNCKVTDVNYTPSLYSPIPQGEPTHSAADGSPVTVATNISRDPPSVAQPRRTPQTSTALPKSEITVFRQPSTLTNSSAGASSVVEPSSTGVTYAQVVFPPDKKKPNDGTTSPKRLAVRADVPLHYLSVEDVRTQLISLKSFNPESQVKKENESDSDKGTDNRSNQNVEKDLDAIVSVNIDTTTTLILNEENGKECDLEKRTGAIPKTTTDPHSNTIRPQSPETDF